MAGHVLNHLCDELERFQKAAEVSCVPSIDAYGKISGCDASNPVYIDFCPFCGARIWNGYFDFTCSGCGFYTRDTDKIAEFVTGVCTDCEMEA